MPMQFEEAQTPGGAPYLRVDTAGEITQADAEALAVRLAPGARFHQQRVLSITHKNTRYTPDARKYLPTINGTYLALAVVIESAVVRAAINIMVRFAGDVGRFAMFRSEADALAWLDEVE